MAKNRFKKYVGAFATAVAVMATAGCADSWDDHYEGGNGNNTAATKTLWELIESDPNLSNFKKIAHKAKYWKDEDHVITSYSFEQLLKSGQMLTVWAPENDYLTDAECQKWLDLCETDGYMVQQQFMSNHIALWRNVISDEKVDTVKMINGKNLQFDKTNHTIEGIGIADNAEDYNIGAMNGTLHKIKGVAPFHYNFYEYIKYAGETPSVTDYVVNNDTLYFSQGASIEGIPDIDGNPTYVDSVYMKSNHIFGSDYQSSYLPEIGSEYWDMAKKTLMARIADEDSMFVMLIPTDEAWQKAKQKLAVNYKYAPIYEDKAKGDIAGSSTSIIARNIPDTLANTSLEMDILSHNVFNINKQPKVGGQSGKLWTLEDFKATLGKEAEYLYTTRKDTLRDIEGEWDKTSLFNGKFMEMSNGHAYLIDDWNFPRQFYKPDVVVEMGWDVFYNTGNTTTVYKVGSDVKLQGFSNSAYSDISSLFGKVTKDNFFYIAPYNGSNPQVEIKLKGNNAPDTYVPNAQVMSGKYDIQLVMVPYWYKKIADDGKIDSTTWYKKEIDEETGEEIASIDLNKRDSLAQLSKNMFKVQIRYNDGSATWKKDQLEKLKTLDEKGKSTENFTYNGEKVDTITVAEDFEFPVSYKNMRFSYPTMVIIGANTSTNAKKGFIYDLCIDRIILKSKEDGSEIVVDAKAAE